MFKEILSKLKFAEKCLLILSFLIESILKFFSIFIILYILMYNEKIENFGRVKFFSICAISYILLFAINYFIKKKNILRFSNLRDDYFKKYIYRCMSMPYAFFENANIMSKGKASNIFVSGYYTGFEKAFKSLMLIGSNFVFIIFIFGTSLRVNYKIALAFLFILVSEIFFIVIVNKKKSIYKDDLSKLEFKITNYSNFATDIKNAKDIRLFNADNLYEIYQNETKNDYEKFLNNYYKIENICNLFLAIITATSIFVIINTLKTESINDIIMIGSLISLFSISVSIILKSAISYHEEKLRYEMFKNFMEITEFNNCSTDFPVFNNKIEFKNVNFSYPGSDKPILKNLSFTIKKGEHIALLGINGAGKSTIVKLLLGFYKPTSGEILIDDYNVKNYSYDVLAKLFAPMFQNVEPLALTIAELVSCEEKENQNRELIVNALKEVGLYKLVSSLDNGIDTSISKILDPNGFVFSGGGNQKLAIARIIYHKSRPIVILDEPTAALDSLSEEKLYLKLDTILKDKTSIFITHRLASVKFLDKILVLNDGFIEEIGSHNELMEKNGIYRKMYDEQAYYYKFEGEL
ncbi:MAG: ABC transporter ATP-binding protein/permease [Ezakiella sp.]|nr:ABC transporter ATP-binding protein/permease [Ezakiella sp.]